MKQFIDLIVQINANCVSFLDCLNVVLILPPICSWIRRIWRPVKSTIKSTQFDCHEHEYKHMKSVNRTIHVNSCLSSLPYAIVYKQSERNYQLSTLANTTHKHARTHIYWSLTRTFVSFQLQTTASISMMYPIVISYQ